VIEYIVRRIAYGFIVVASVTVLVFVVMNLVPGDAVTLQLQESGGATAERAAELREQFGLDDPVYVQLGSWVGNALQGDLGRSFFTDEPVMATFAERVPVTLQLGGLSMLVGILFGITLGVVSATRRGSKTDNTVRVVAVTGLSVPNYVVGLLALTMLGIYFSWSPPLVYRSPTENFGSWLEQMIIPVLAIGLASMASIARMTRSSMLEVLGSNFIRTIRAKGAPQRAVVFKHGLRNSFIAVFTLIGVQLGTILGGTVILESMYGLPGTGQLIYESVLNRDYPIVVACTIFYAALYAAVTLAVDLAYGLIDPRIRHSTVGR
jgi:peptide/nickel transport system permease protein